MRVALKRVYRFVNPTESQRLINKQRKRTPALIADYFKSGGKKKLHIGCQHHPIDGWLNIDIAPSLDNVAYMDATRKFPFKNDSFDFVFSEHMIEHITLSEGIFMMNESYRVLKPGGKVRIVTPDLKFLVNLYRSEKSTVQQAYIDSYKKFFPEEDFINDTMVINHFVRAWGHKFVYDKKTLSIILEKAGFKKIQFPSVGESSISELNGIDQHGDEIGNDFNQLESIVIEAEK